MRETDEISSHPAIIYPVPYAGIEVIDKANVTVQNCDVRDLPTGVFWYQAVDGKCQYNTFGKSGWRCTQDRFHVQITPTLSGGHGHAIYGQNVSGVTTLRGNIFANSCGVFQLFSTNGSVNGFHVLDNIILDEIYVGAQNSGVNGLVMDGNIISSYHANLGYDREEPHNEDVVFTNNFVRLTSAVRSAGMSFNLWRNATVVGNTFWTDWRVWDYYPHPESEIAPEDWDYNTYYLEGQDKPFYIQGLGYLYPDEWQAETGFDANSTFIAGKPPAEVRVAFNPTNHDRAFITVINSDDTETVEIPLTDLQLNPAKPYQLYYVESDAPHGEPFSGSAESIVVSTSGAENTPPAGWPVEYDWIPATLDSAQVGVFVLKAI